MQLVRLVCGLLDVASGYIPIVQTCWKQASVLDTVDVLLHRCIIERQAESRQYKLVVLDFWSGYEGLLPWCTLKHVAGWSEISQPQVGIRTR